jgi:hypothetical protein
LFYSQGGRKIEVYDENLTHPRNLKLVEYPTEFRLIVFANVSQDIDQSTLFVHWNDVSEDTLICRFWKGENHLTIDKIWFNGEPVWDLNEDGDNRYFTIEK